MTCNHIPPHSRDDRAFTCSLCGDGYGCDRYEHRCRNIPTSDHPKHEHTRTGAPFTTAEPMTYSHEHPHGREQHKHHADEK